MDTRSSARSVVLALSVLLAVTVIAAVDFLSGVELRVFPLYYGPITLAAWHFGRRGAVIAALLCAAGWVEANRLAGLRFSHAGIWVANTVVQAGSFTVVGLLVAHLRKSILNERKTARVDPLVGLLNSRAFGEESARLLALCRREGRPITLAYLDLDNFKTVNDSGGHKAGDELLVRVAQTLTASIRASDLAARLGGDEFAVLLPQLGPAEAQRAVERLRASLRLAIGKAYPGVTVSIGAVTFTTTPESIAPLLHKADQIMYAAKRAGKDRLCFEVVAHGG